jgi:hypothetical protein
MGSRLDVCRSKCHRILLCPQFPHTWNVLANRAPFHDEVRGDAGGSNTLGSLLMSHNEGFKMTVPLHDATYAGESTPGAQPPRIMRASTDRVQSTNQPDTVASPLHTTLLIRTFRWIACAITTCTPLLIRTFRRIACITTISTWVHHLV